MYEGTLLKYWCFTTVYAGVCFSCVTLIINSMALKMEVFGTSSYDSSTVGTGGLKLIGSYFLSLHCPLNAVLQVLVDGLFAARCKHLDPHFN